ncbi:unnamed protein product [Soboliphyme baturini]|uniref:Protein kinase domain-containing protein n=1 Tax=Soboliphyme baturini TaxID=241478 RepID=A0A183IK76_9BILA|nr:unnamed protein product [Soboliphyme baturini]
MPNPASNRDGSINYEDGISITPHCKWQSLKEGGSDRAEPLVPLDHRLIEARGMASITTALTDENIRKYLTAVLKSSYPPDRRPNVLNYIDTLSPYLRNYQTKNCIQDLLQKKTRNSPYSREEGLGAVVLINSRKGIIKCLIDPHALHTKDDSSLGKRRKDEKEETLSNRRNKNLAVTGGGPVDEFDSKAMTTPPPPPRSGLWAGVNKRRPEVVPAAGPPSVQAPPYILSESCATGSEDVNESQDLDRIRGSYEPPLPAMNNDTSAFSRRFDERVYAKSRSSKFSARARAEMRRLRRVSDSSTASEIDEASAMFLREKQAFLKVSATHPSTATESATANELLSGELQIKLSTTSTEGDSEEEDHCYGSSKESAMGNTNHMSDSTCFDEMYSISQANKFVPPPSMSSLTSKLPPPTPPKPRQEATPSISCVIATSTPSSTRNITTRLTSMKNHVSSTPTTPLATESKKSQRPQYSSGSIRLDLDEPSDVSRISVHTSASTSKEALIMKNHFGDIPDFLYDSHAASPRIIKNDYSYPASPVIKRPEKREANSLRVSSFREKVAHSLRNMLHKDRHTCDRNQSEYKTYESQPRHLPLADVALNTGHCYDSCPRLTNLRRCDFCDSSGRTPVSYRDEGTQYRSSDLADDHQAERLRQDVKIQTSEHRFDIPQRNTSPHSTDRLMHMNTLNDAWRNYVAVGYSSVDDFRTLSLARMEIGHALDSLKALMESEAANCLCEISTGHIRRCYTILQNVNDLLFCQAYSRPLLTRSSTLSSMNEPTAEPWKSTLRHFSKEPSPPMSFMEIERLLIRLRRCLVDTAFSNAMRDFEYLSHT